VGLLSLPGLSGTGLTHLGSMTEYGNEKYGLGRLKKRGSSTQTGQMTWQHPTGKKMTVRKLKNS
jgi:hypothetical protein